MLPRRTGVSNAGAAWSVVFTVCTCAAAGAGSSVAAAQQQPLQLSWSELARAISGKHVLLVLPDGVHVEGKALSLDADALVIDVKRTSDRSVQAKGLTRVPRTSVGALKVVERQGPWRVFGAIGGGLLSSYLATRVGVDDDNSNLSAGAYYALVIAVPAGGAIGGYYAGRAVDTRVTEIRVVPDTVTRFGIKR